MATILVVDDVQQIRDNAMRALRFEGHHVWGAADGLTGLAMAQTHIPDLVICDVMMPGLDGYQLLAQLRQDARTKRCEFIFLTAKGNREDMRLGMEMGADDYLAKPFSVSELLAAVTARIEKRERVRQLETSLHELEQSNSFRRDLLSTASHELRTPIATMKLAICLLKEHPTKVDQVRYLNILERECQRESDLVNDLLVLQQLESNIPLQYQEIVLEGWLPGLVETFRFKAANRQQIFHAQIAQGLPVIYTYRVGLERILVELLTNACKYTAPEGSIGLGVTFIKEPEPKLCFTVTNSTAIPQSELPLIFEKFYRIPQGDPWQQGGTGLGLTLVNQLVSRLDGTIDVYSDTALTRFTVSIPQGSVPQGDPE